MKILVLDDDLARMKVFKDRLQNHLGAKYVDYVYTADEALEKLAQTPDYDYIFLDHDLGGKQMEWEQDNCGMNVVKWIIENNYRKNVSIIVHSWNIPQAQKMYTTLVNAGYPAIQSPGAWNIIG